MDSLGNKKQCDDLLHGCLMMNSLCLFSAATGEWVTTNTARGELPKSCSPFPRERGWAEIGVWMGLAAPVCPRPSLARGLHVRRVVWHMGSVWGTGGTQTHQVRSERNLDLLVKGIENGQKKRRETQRRKTRICNSNPFIPEGLVKQLLAIALVHFNMLTDPQLLVTALSAGVWSTDHFLLLLYSTKSDRFPHEG